MAFAIGLAGTGWGRIGSPLDSRRDHSPGVSRKSTSASRTKSPAFQQIQPANPGNSEYAPSPKSPQIPRRSEFFAGDELLLLLAGKHGRPRFASAGSLQRDD